MAQGNRWITRTGMTSARVRGSVGDGAGRWAPPQHHVTSMASVVALTSFGIGEGQRPPTDEGGGSRGPRTTAAPPGMQVTGKI